jgi:N-acetylneuraminate synthase
MSPTLTLKNRVISRGQPVYVVAEMSANHNHDFDQAVRIIEEMKKAGADAVKLQTYTPDTLTIDCDNDYFRIGSGSLWEGRNLYDLYGEAYTPWEWHPKLKAVAEDLGLDFFSTPFDESSIEFLESLDVGIYKVASFEVIDLPLIERIARTGKPMIISTGMATQTEVEEAVRTAREAGSGQIALLKCTSAYPAPPAEMHLNTIPDMAKMFDVPVGLSDHTLGTTVPVAAVAVGACIVEKHFALSRDIPGPDSAFSLEPHEFKAMVDAIRVTEQALGGVRYGAGEEEAKSRVFRRSIFVVKDIKAGEAFTSENIRSIRPGDGIPPKHIREVVGHQATKDIQRGTPLAWEHIADR